MVLFLRLFANTPGGAGRIGSSIIEKILEENVSDKTPSKSWSDNSVDNSVDNSIDSSSESSANRTSVNSSVCTTLSDEYVLLKFRKKIGQLMALSFIAKLFSVDILISISTVIFCGIFHEYFTKILYFSFL